ncbi:hypothetical protein D5086_028036 [Populus alba]|uniref:Uncharacterized protein n=1 Tax=Populus alba TaxID=43335 RepID=A0ACC4AXZ7_POPAL
MLTASSSLHGSPDLFQAYDLETRVIFLCPEGIMDTNEATGSSYCLYRRQVEEHRAKEIPNPRPAADGLARPARLIVQVTCTASIYS